MKRWRLQPPTIDTEKIQIHTLSALAVMGNEGFSYWVVGCFACLDKEVFYTVNPPMKARAGGQENRLLPSTGSDNGHVTEVFASVSPFIKAE